MKKEKVGKNMVRFPYKRKLKEKFNVNAAILDIEKGYSTLKPVKVESGEILHDPDKEKGQIYNGVYPTILEFSRKLFPVKCRYLIPRKFRVRLYSKLVHEPFTRSLFSGKWLDSEKKHQILMERNVIDEEGYLLDEKGNRKEVQFGAGKKDERVHVKVDVSDIDFVKSEFHAYHQSKNNEKIAQAMKKAGRDMEKMVLWMFLIAFAAVVLIVFFMSGGF